MKWEPKTGGRTGTRERERERRKRRERKSDSIKNPIVYYLLRPSKNLEHK